MAVVGEQYESEDEAKTPPMDESYDTENDKHEVFSESQIDDSVQDFAGVLCSNQDRHK